MNEQSIGFVFPQQPKPTRAAGPSRPSFAPKPPQKFLRKKGEKSSEGEARRGMETSDGAVEETHSTHTEKDVDKEVESVRVVVVRVCGDGEAHAVSVLWRGGVVSSTELQDAVREAFLVAHKDAVWVMDTRGDVLLGEEDTGPLLSLGDRRTLFLALSPEERDAVVARQQQPAALLSMHMNVTPHVNILVRLSSLPHSLHWSL